VHDLDQSALMSVEFIGAVLLYGGLGLLADRWLGTGPWLASLGALVGLAAGLYLLWLRSERMDSEPDADNAAERP
jgi:F0F1-type ATP synthase assembly protein I